MAKIPRRNLWCRKKWLAKAATTSAGKHDVIVEMTYVHGANEKRKEEERRGEERRGEEKRWIYGFICQKRGGKEASKQWMVMVLARSFEL